MLKSAEEITVCPNCGKDTGIGDYLKNSSSKTIMSVIRCGNCRYYGLPISVQKSKLGKIKFKNARITEDRNKPMGPMEKIFFLGLGAIIMIAIALMAFLIYLKMTS